MRVNVHAQATRERFESGEGDHLTLLKAYTEWRRVPPAEADGWCRRVNAAACVGVACMRRSS